MRASIGPPTTVKTSGCPGSSPAQVALVARQPVVDTERNVYGYELLYRSEIDETSRFEDGRHATATVLQNLFLEFGIERVVGRHRALVNLPREFLTGQLKLPPRPDLIVAEILEDVEIDDEVVVGVERLRSAGFTIALDDVVYEPRLEPLLKLAQIVKVDLPRVPASDLSRHVQEFRRWPVQLLAEKVETREQFDECRELGFEFFQGYFLSKPAILRRERLPAKKHVVVQLLAKLCMRNQSLQELSRTVKQDPALCTKLLRYINSARFGIGNLTSIDHAIALLGTRGLHSLLTMLHLAGLSDQPQELVTTALLRGLMCHAIAKSIGSEHDDRYFLLGILSCLDALMNEPLSEVLDQMPLSEELRAALLAREGELGGLLNSVIAYERGDWRAVAFRNVAIEEFRDAYLAALAEAELIATCVALQGC